MSYSTIPTPPLGSDPDDPDDPDDPFVVEYGELHATNAYRRLGRPARGHVYPMAFTDGLQYQHSRPPSFRFRFILTSYAGTWRDAHIPSFAARQVGSLASDREVSARISATAPNVELVALKVAEDGNGLIARFRETEGRVTDASVRQSLVKGGGFERVSVIEEPLGDRGAGGGVFRFRPFETVTLRLTGKLPAIAYAPAEPWTGLLTRLCAFAGGKGGPTYLLWKTDDAPTFNHYELFRDGELLATVTNIVDEGVLYRNACYEDLASAPGRQHSYSVRSVYRDGTRGKEESCLSAP